MRHAAIRDATMRERSTGDLQHIFICTPFIDMLPFNEPTPVSCVYGVAGKRTPKTARQDVPFEGSMSIETSSFPPPSHPPAVPAESRASKPAVDAAPLTGATLFYDGTCGFCSGIIQFILRHESSRQTLHFATLQGPAAAALRQKHPQLANVDSVVWYDPATAKRRERVRVRSAAGLAAAAYLGGMWRFLAALAWWVPRPIRDAVYNLVARNRHRLVRNDACLLPTPEQRARFLD